MLGIPFEKLIKAIGHDGSEIVHAGMPEPLCRRAFVLPEVVAAGIKLGIPLFTLEVRASVSENSDIILFTKDQIELFLDDALLFGTVNDQAHAVHCHKRWIYDPNGTSYSVEEFTIYAIVIRMDALCTTKLFLLSQLPNSVREISAING